MQFNELDILRKQILILTNRLSALEEENAKHIAMLQIIEESMKQDENKVEDKA